MKMNADKNGGLTLKKAMVEFEENSDDGGGNAYNSASIIDQTPWTTRLGF